MYVQSNVKCVHETIHAVEKQGLGEPQGRSGPVRKILP